MERWYRVFGTRADPPDPAVLLAHLDNADFRLTAAFKGDSEGWTRAELVLPGEVVIAIDRYLATELGIRAELNSWAAWVESRDDNPVPIRLMEQFIQANQLIVFPVPVDSADANRAAEVLCRKLATMTAGVYQIDGQGVSNADGTMLVPEES